MSLEYTFKYLNINFFNLIIQKFNVEMLNTQTPEKKFTFISLGVDRTGQHGKLKYSNRIIFREENIWNAYIIFIPIIIIIIYEINFMLTFN
jgi:hypothetical protein